MVTAGLLILAFSYCILGAVVIICPHKIKQKLNGATNSTIRWYGFAIFLLGVFLSAVAVFIYELSVLILKVTE